MPHAEVLYNPLQKTFTDVAQVMKQNTNTFQQSAEKKEIDGFSYNEDSRNRSTTKEKDKISYKQKYGYKE